MNISKEFIDNLNVLKNEKTSTEEMIFDLAIKYTDISSQINKSTTQKPYLEYFKMHKDFINFMNSAIEKIDSSQSKLTCIKIKLSIVEIHDSIKKEYHRKNNFIQNLALRFL